MHTDIRRHSYTTKMKWNEDAKQIIELIRAEEQIAEPVELVNRLQYSIATAEAGVEAEREEHQSSEGHNMTK